MSGTGFWPFALSPPLPPSPPAPGDGAVGGMMSGDPALRLVPPSGWPPGVAAGGLLSSSIAFPMVGGTGFWPFDPSGDAMSVDLALHLVPPPGWPPGVVARGPHSAPGKRSREVPVDDTRGGRHRGPPDERISQAGETGSWPFDPPPPRLPPPPAPVAGAVGGTINMGSALHLVSPCVWPPGVVAGPQSSSSLSMSISTASAFDVPSWLDGDEVVMEPRQVLRGAMAPETPSFSWSRSSYGSPQPAAASPAKTIPSVVVSSPESSVRSRSPCRTDPSQPLLPIGELADSSPPTSSVMALRQLLWRTMAPATPVSGWSRSLHGPSTSASAVSARSPESSGAGSTPRQSALSRSPCSTDPSQPSPSIRMADPYPPASSTLGLVASLAPTNILMSIRSRGPLACTIPCQESLDQVKCRVSTPYPSVHCPPRKASRTEERGASSTRATYGGSYGSGDFAPLSRDPEDSASESAVRKRCSPG